MSRHGLHHLLRRQRHVRLRQLRQRQPRRGREGHQRSSEAAKGAARSSCRCLFSVVFVVFETSVFLVFVLLFMVSFWRSYLGRKSKAPLFSSGRMPRNSEHVCFSSLRIVHILYILVSFSHRCFRTYLLLRCFSLTEPTESEHEHIDFRSMLSLLRRTPTAQFSKSLTETCPPKLNLS